MQIDVNNKKKYEQLLKQDIRRSREIVYRNVVALLNLKGHDTFQSLVIMNDGLIYGSEKTTKRLIHEMGEQLGVTYDQFVDKVSEKGTRYKIPYVYKNIIALPESGVARGSVNWFFLQQLVDYDVRKPLNTIELYYDKTVIQTKIVKEGFIKQLQFIYDHYYRQIKEIAEWQFTDEIRSSLIFKNTLNYQKNDLLNEWGPKY